MQTTNFSRVYSKMNAKSRNLRYSLRTTALTSFVILCLPIAAQAFNPNEGAELTATSRTVPSRLPSTAPLTGTPKLVFPESIGTPLAAQPAPITLEPSPFAAQPLPVFPPVDPATRAAAMQELQVTSPTLPAATITPELPPQQGFIAPAPLLAIAPAVTTSSPAPLPPAAVQPAVASLDPIPSAIAQPTSPAPDKLSDESKTILSHIPSKIETPKQKAGGKMAISRMSPGIQAFPEKKVETYDAVGLSIKVARPGLDSNFELNRAYNALMGGDTITAIDAYKNIIASEPENEDALFGLATIYHRLGQLDKARPYYAALLQVNPNHREGLNNFLALVSEESPQEALAELERLEQRNPDFSPIPAQQATVLQKLGYPDRAREKMLRAMELAPENLTYAYNLAVMLDRDGYYNDAAALYRMLIDASLKGAKVPAPMETLQKRLNFIATTTTVRATAGN